MVKLISSDIIESKGIWRLFWVVLYLGILIVTIYGLFFVYPVEKRLYEECNLQILCKYEKIDHKICEKYQLPTIDIIPNLTN
jgi:hypothetical protein